MREHGAVPRELAGGGYAAEVAIEGAEGLHARPAADFVQRATGFDARITLRHGDREADAKSMLMILSLAAGTGARVHLEASGPEAEAAVRALAAQLAPGVAAQG